MMCSANRSLLPGLALAVVLLHEGAVAQTHWSIQYTETGNISLGLDAVDADHCWIAGAQNGIGPRVGRTSDGGASWEWIVTEINQSMFWLDVDMATNEVGYVAGVGVFASGAAKTTDGGSTWTTIEPIPGVHFASAWNDVFALDEDRVWYAGTVGGLVGTSDGVAYSTDGGATFQFTDPGSGSYAKSIFFIDENTGWLTSGEFPDDEGGGQYYGVIQRTTDGGASWTTQFTTSSYTAYWLHFTDAQNGWVVGQGLTGSVIFHTNDGGNSWDTQTLPNGSNLNLGSVQMFDPLHGWAVGWTPGAFNPIVALYETHDGGVNWVRDAFQPPHGPIQISMVDEHKGWCVGANNSQVGAIMVYDDGGYTCPDPQVYCTAAENSVSLGGSPIGWSGTTSVAADDLVLTADALPTGQFGIFYYGPNQLSIPFGNGFRCVGGGVHRLPPQPTTGGSVSFELDIANPPSLNGRIDPGETWNFQFWYRDPGDGGANFNFTDGLEATFCE